MHWRPTIQGSTIACAMGTTDLGPDPQNVNAFNNMGLIHTDLTNLNSRSPEHKDMFEPCIICFKQIISLLFLC